MAMFDRRLMQVRDPASTLIAAALRVHLMVVIGLAAAGCGSPGPVAVDLDELAEEQGAWNGRVVEVAGVMRSHPDPLHFWVEDEAQHRVELWPPVEGYGGMVGRAVVVRGRFTFVEGEGRRIAVDELEAPDG